MTHDEATAWLTKQVEALADYGPGAPIQLALHPVVVKALSSQRGCPKILEPFVQAMQEREVSQVLLTVPQAEELLRDVRRRSESRRRPADL
jgi:hypothetical protein